MKKTFVGYDLGDGETITDYVTIDIRKNNVKEKHDFPGMCMPDQNVPGIAVPTAFAKNENGKLVFASSILDMPDLCHEITVNFKRRPTDLLGNINEQRINELLGLFSKCQKWSSDNLCEECSNSKFVNFKNSVIAFTNAIFENPQFKEKLRSEAIDSSSIVFCVGHPTKWNDLDIAIYRAIIGTSVLGNGEYAGKPSEFVMAAESRAAFLYVKDKADAAVLPKGTCALLIDIGSSTIDLTAMTADSRNNQYNSGNNYLGARGIDFIIRDWYLGELGKDQREWNNFQEILTYNPSVDKALTLACRRTKEKIYSTVAGVAKVDCEGLKRIPLTIKELESLIDNRPISDILKNNIGLPKDVYYAMGHKTWKQLFEEFLQDSKREMDNHNIIISRIILTGSASRMPFVVPIIKKVFNNISYNNILNDTDPSRTISKGLALVGPSNEKSKEFQKSLNDILDKKIPDIVSKNIPTLASSIGTIIEDIIVGIMKKRINSWRNGNITTLDEMTRLIKLDCSEENIHKAIENSKDYNEAIKKWLTNDVSKSIAVELKTLCNKYGIDEFSLEDLNIMKIPNISTTGIKVDPTDFAQIIVGVVSVLAGIIGAIVLPFVMGFVVGIISWVSVGLASLLLSILLAIPGAGWAILLGIAGILIIRAASKGLESARNELSAKLQKVNLPQWVRNRISDDKINKQIKEANIKGKIESAILNEESKKEIVDSVVISLKQQVQKRAEDIKYIIEAK